MDPDRRQVGLLAWQWAGYRERHRDRVNLAIDLATAPLFTGGSLLVLATPLLWWLAPSLWWIPLAGLAGMALAAAAQGRGHRREGCAPLPFAGGLDVAARLFSEQWVTFPRYVLSGELFRSWRDR